MQHVSVHEAKTHLSRFLKQIAAGGEIIITSNGKPVGRLAAIEPAVKARRIPPKDLLAWGKKHPLPADFDEPMPNEWFETDIYPQKRRKKKS